MGRVKVRLPLRSPVTTILVRHKVKDFAKWKAVYDSMDAFHRAHGVKNAQILRGAEDPNQVVVLSELENLTKAREFALLDELKKIMEQGGVADHPDIYFLEHAGRHSFT